MIPEEKKGQKYGKHVYSMSWWGVPTGNLIVKRAAWDGHGDASRWLIPISRL